ncbi:MAG TPA: hypothetical protein VHZ81_08310 [Galbitalea sp.]|nr:hypothetical protein [Galbitalea sp.]
MTAAVLDRVRTGELTVDVTTMPLNHIETAWTRIELRGCLVIIAD